MRRTTALALACGWFVLASMGAADSPTRSAPSRPKPSRAPASARVAQAARAPRAGEYVPIKNVAAITGLKFTWLEPGRRLLLTDGGVKKVELEVDSRETLVNGLRVFLGNPIIAARGDVMISRIDFERCLAPLVRPSVCGPAPGPVRVIALDPGHGGKDNGMENRELKLKEKVLALDVAQRLKRILDGLGYKVVLTRPTDDALHPDKKTDMLRRIKLANDAGADLFISIHFNSLFPDKRTGGTEVYTFTRATQRSDQSWGFREGDDAQDESEPINRYDAWSSLLAHDLHRELREGLKTADRGQKTKHLAVLRGLNCPGALVESVFLSNEIEARRAATPEYRQRIADSLALGITSYVATIDQLRKRG